MLRVEFQDTKTHKPVKVPRFYLTWYDFDTANKQEAVESMCIGQNEFDSLQSSFSENEYLSYFEVKAADPESVKKYYKAALPLRPPLSAENLEKLGKRLDNTVCFVGSCGAQLVFMFGWVRVRVRVAMKVRGCA